jgi:hypothetical protein
MNRAMFCDGPIPDSSFVDLKIMSNQGLCPLNLLVMPFFCGIVIASPPQTSTQTVRIEMPNLLREPWSVMSTNKPRSHPVLVGRQMGDPGVNMVPLKPISPALAKNSLNVRVKLAQVMK